MVKEPFKAISNFSEHVRKIIKNFISTKGPRKEASLLALCRCVNDGNLLEVSIKGQKDKHNYKMCKMEIRH